METITDLFKQLGGGVKVNLSGSHIHMPHIGCQGREPGVDILTIPVPCQQSMDGKGMTQVMDTWAGMFIVSDAALFKQLPEGMMDGAMAQPAGPQIDEQRRVRGQWAVPKTAL